MGDRWTVTALVGATAAGAGLFGLVFHLWHAQISVGRANAVSRCLDTMQLAELRGDHQEQWLPLDVSESAPGYRGEAALDWCDRFVEQGGRGLGGVVPLRADELWEEAQRKAAREEAPSSGHDHGTANGLRRCHPDPGHGEDCPPGFCCTWKDEDGGYIEPPVCLPNVRGYGDTPPDTTEGRDG